MSRQASESSDSSGPSRTGSNTSNLSLRDRRVARNPKPKPGRVDDDQEDVPWYHLLTKTGEPLWSLHDEEKAFWTKLSELDTQAPIEYARSKKMAGKPVDFFLYRQFICEKGRNAHQPDYTNSMQRFKHYFKSGGKNGQSSKGLYNELYEFLRTGRVPGAQQIDSKSRLKLHYEKVLKPMEQVYHYEPLTQQSESPRRRTSVAGHSASASPFPAFPADATAALEDANTSAQLWMTLQDRLGDISRLLPDLYVGKQSTSIKAVQQGVSRLKEKLGQTQDGYGDLRIVAILGKNRIGKSFMLNQLLALTEAPNSLYNRGNESFESEDAAHCATRLYCDEVFGIGAAEGSNDEFYDRILAKITDVDHVHTGSQERYLARCDFSKVLWSFPKIGDEDWADFTHDGRINANLSRYKENYEGSSREDVRDAFLEYLQPKGGRPMSKFCEFLLPSNPSEASVTSHNTYVWGGAQYAIVVKYIGAAALQRLIKSVSRTDNDGGGELRLKQKETLLKMMYRLEHGVVAGMQECDEEDDWVSEEMENEQLPSWWADKGCKKSGAANEADYGNVHPTVRSNFDKIHIIQGSGQRPQDDRVYIKSVLSDLHAEEQKYMQMLIDEIHIIAPSSELTRHTALVDTPGVDDEDPNKFVQLQNALHRSCGFLVYMNTTIEAGQSTLKAMGDHGVLDRVVKGFGKQQDKERDEKAVFVHCYEASPGVDINKILRPLPKEDAGSLINDGNIEATTKKLEKAVLSWKKVIQNHVTKSIWDDGLLIDSCSKSEFDEDSKSVFRTAVRERISKPLAQQRTHVILVGIHRGIIEALFGAGQDAASPAQRSMLQHSLHQTGFNSVIKELRSMLQGMISAAEIKEFAARCRELTEVVTDAPQVEIPEALRAQANRLAKARTTSVDLRKEFHDVVDDALCIDGAPWAAALVDQLIEVLPAFAETFRGLTHAKLIKQQHAQTVLADCIALCADGSLFQSDNVMSKAAFNLCRPVFKMESLWADYFKSPVEAALKSVQEALARFCCQKLDPAGESKVVTDAVNHALSTTFNTAAKLNHMRERFLNCTKHFVTKPKAFFTSDPINSLPQFALEQLFGLIFAKYGPCKTDVFLRGNRHGSESRKELGGLFAPRSLHEHREELVQLISNEVSVLRDVIHSEVMTIFETVGKRGRVSGVKTTKFIKSTFAEVGAADKMVDATLQTEGSAVPKFKEAAAAVERLSAELASMEEDDVATDNAIVRTMAAKAMLDDFEATTKLPAQLENADFKEPSNRGNGWRWDHGHENLVSWGSPFLPSVWPELDTKRDPTAGPATEVIAGTLPSELGALLLEVKGGAKLLPADPGCQGSLRLFDLLRFAVDGQRGPAAAKILQRYLDLQIANRSSVERASAAAADNLLRAYLAKFAARFHTRVELYILGSEPGDECAVNTEPDKTAGGAALRFSIRLVWDPATAAPYLIHIPRKTKRAHTPDLDEVSECHQFEVSDYEKQGKIAAISEINRKVSENYTAREQGIAAGGMRQRPKGQYSKDERARASQKANASYGLVDSPQSYGSELRSSKRLKPQPREWKGWTEMHSRRTGKPYWTKDGESTYTKPVGFPSPTTSPASSPQEKTSSVPTRSWQDWREYRSSSTGRLFYRQLGSKESKWSPPPGFPKQAQSPAKSPGKSPEEDEMVDIVAAARGGKR